MRLHTVHGCALTLFIRSRKSFSGNHVNAAWCRSFSAACVYKPLKCFHGEMSDGAHQKAGVVYAFLQTSSQEKGLHRAKNGEARTGTESPSKGTTIGGTCLRGRFFERLEPYGLRVLANNPPGLCDGFGRRVCFKHAGSGRT